MKKVLFLSACVSLVCALCACSAQPAADADRALSTASPAASESASAASSSAETSLPEATPAPTPSPSPEAAPSDTHALIRYDSIYDVLGMQLGYTKFAKGKVIDLIAPMIVMIFTAIATMIWTGYLNGGTNLVEDFANCSSSESLVFAGLVTVGFLLLFYLPRRVIGFKDFMNSVPEGGKLMMPPILILVLAWTLKGMTDALGIGDFVRQAVSLNAGLMRFVPLLIFCIAIFIAFSSGTSWGTFAILVPIVVNMFSETDPTMMIVAVSAVLAGAVCGDHISPISDTTIMSSSGAQSNHINHVQTQMQYAMVVGAACVPGYLIAGFTENWLITLAASLAILTALLLYLRRRSMAEDIDAAVKAAD